MKKAFTLRFLLTHLAALIGVASSFGQLTSITTGAVTPSPVCVGSNVSVAFSVVGTLPAASTYKAQLSDAAGSFTSPVDIGSGTTSPITGTIPSGTAAGSAYVVRVISVLTAAPTVPVVTGSSSSAITVTALPAAPTVTTPVNYYTGVTATALTATGTGLKWYDVSTNGSALSGAPTPTTTSAGTTSYYVSQTVASCEGPRAQIDVVVTACPTVAPTVTTPVNYNVGATAAILTATGSGSLIWYDVATNGTALSGAPTPGTTAGDIGTKSYWVSQTVSGCEGPRAKIDVVVTCATVAPGVTTPVNYNSGQTATALTATGTALKWYDVATDGAALPGAPTPTTTAVGTTSYWVSQTLNGCEGPRAKIDVVVAACPTVAPTVTTPVNYNVGATAVALTATGSGTLHWYDVATNGTALSGAPTPGTTAGDIGTKSYWVSQTVSGCEGPRAKIDVVVTCATVAPGVTTPVNYNVGATAAALTATGSTLKWYDVATNGAALSGAPTPGTTAGDIGTKSYWVSQTVNGCEGPRAKIDVVVTCATAAPGVTTPVNYNTGQTATALTATGTALKWYDVATNGVALSGAPTPTTTAVGTTSYWVSQTLNGCEGPRAKIDVVVSACPTTAPTVTTPVNYNVGATAAALTATGTALKWYTVATDGVSSGTAPTPGTTAADIGTKSWWVSQTVSGCEGPRAKIDVVVVCGTAAPGVTTPVNYNVGATAAALTATGTALKWYTVATDGVSSGTAPTPGTLAADIGTKSWWVSQTLNSCEGPRAKIDVVVTCGTAAPGVTTPVNYNSGQTATALTATGTGLKWYDVATNGVALAGAPTPSTAAVGTTSYWVSQTLNNCEGPRAKIDVVVAACPTVAPTVTTPVNYNVGATATVLTATGSGTFKWYDVATNGAALGTAPTPGTTAADIGTKSYWVSQVVGGCEGPRAKIDVIVTCATTAPTVITPVSYNVGATASALTANGSGLKWYTVEVSGTALPGAPTPGTTASDIGTKSWWVSQTLNGCEGPRAKIDVVVTCATAAPGVSTPVNYCVGATAVALTATGTALKWYDVATNGTALAGAPTPSTAAVGTTSYWVSQTLNGCEGPRAKIDVVVAQTAVPTVSAVEYCKDVTAVALTAPGATSPKWYTQASSGTGVTTAPTPLTATVGVTSYYVTQTVGLCESPRVEQKVTIKAVPAIPTVVGLAYCKNETATALSATAAGGATLNWYGTSSTGGTASPTAPTPSTADGASYYVSQTGTNGCESPRAALLVTIKPLPAKPGVANLEYCQFAGAAGLTATAVTNASLNWYGTNETGGTSSAVGPVPSTLNGGTTSFYVAQTLDGCTSDRARIDVLIKTTPKPQTTTYLEFCQGASGSQLTATGTNLKWYRDANTATFQTNPFTPFNEKVEDYYFYVTQTGSNGCESPREEIKIHVKGLPSAEISGTTSIAFGEAVSVKVKFGGEGPWTYKLSDGTTGTTANANVDIPVKPTTTTTYLVTEVSNACGKGVPLGSAIITVRVPTISTGNPTVAEVCAGKTMVVPFQQSGSFPAGFTFKLQIALTNTAAAFKTVPSVATSSQVTATIPDTTRGGAYFLRIVSSNAAGDQVVPGSVAGIGVTINAMPAATMSGSRTILLGESADLKVELVGKAPWTLNLNDGTKDSSMTVNLTPFNIVVKPKATTTYTITNIVNVCGTVAKGTGSARIQVDPILGLEPKANNFAKVYPTVVNGSCIVELDEPVSPKVSDVELMSVSGKTLRNQQIRAKLTEVDFSALPVGLYLLKVVNGNHTSVHRIMKQ